MLLSIVVSVNALNVTGGMLPGRFKSTLSSNYLTQNEDDEPFTE